jgi:hypothetical protein
MNGLIWNPAPEAEMNIPGIADLTEEGKQTSVISGAVRAYSVKFHLPGIRACI